MAMDSLEFDRRVQLVEDALYALKNSGYAQAPDISAIDAMLACTAELKVELYGMLVGWNNRAKPLTLRRRMMLKFDELRDRIAMRLT